MVNSSVKKTVAVTWAVLVIAAGSWSAPVAAAQYDVVVIGGTPAGIAAALAAGRAGKNVMLVEQAPVLGGVLSSGVANMDDEPLEATSGVMEEFRQRVKKYHLDELADDPLVKEHLARPRRRHSVAEGQAWEPKTAARIYAEMVAEVPTITARFNEVPVAATVKGDRVVAVITQDRDNNGRLGAKHRYAGRVIIDATYEGDVAAFAGVPFRIGREPRSREEPHAGHIYSCYVVGPVPEVLPETILPGGTGRGDERMQAFHFRFVAKDYGRADHPYRLKVPPPGYEAAKYTWDPRIGPRLPNGKRDMLGAGELAGYSTRYVLADWDERAEIEKIFRNHELGWLYYIQTKGDSPQWGLPDDEFTDNGHWPYRLYVRQGRRIEGLYTMTESDIHKDLRGNGLRGPLHPQSVAIGSFHMDVHDVQSPTDPGALCGKGIGEGRLHLLDATGPYQIPYGMMVPKNRNGLLVPVAISSTHIAMSSVRVEPVWSSLGQAAGVAATLALDSGQALRAISIKKIQESLLQQCSLLFYYMDMPCDREDFAAVQKLSLLGAVDGEANYQFHPDQPITLGAFARLVVKGLDIPVSITAAHFKDVPREHAAFEYIETLYDYSTQSEEPFFPFTVKEYMNVQLSGPFILGSPVFAHPENAVTSQLAVRIVSGLLKIVPFVHPDHALLGTDSKAVSGIMRNTVAEPVDPDYILKRGEAARLIDQLRE